MSSAKCAIWCGPSCRRVFWWSSVIELPQWYACLATDPSGNNPGLDASSEETVRIGALTVFRPSRGCEIATFGSPSSPSAVVFDGYLFDRDALALDLGLRKACNHAELAAAAYQRWGADVFDKLEGSYLVAVWDAQSRRLLIGHDQLGRHPVFYATPPGVVWFSPNILALTSSGHVSRRPNRL